MEINCTLCDGTGVLEYDGMVIECSGCGGNGTVNPDDDVTWDDESDKWEYYHHYNGGLSDE
jgi:DnaJ-class molecular chaperone